MSDTELEQTLVERLLSQVSLRDRRRLQSAVEMCRISHIRQFEKSGGKYFHKMLRFGHSIASFDLPVDFVVAAVLSDVIGDTSTRESDVLSEFGDLVVGVISSYRIVYDRNYDRQKHERRGYISEIDAYRSYWNHRIQNFLTACIWADGGVYRSLSLIDHDAISPLRFIDQQDGRTISLKDAPLRIRNAVENLIGYASKNSDLLHRISPREFEIMIAGLLRQLGYDVEITSESRDGGVDIFAFKSDGFTIGKFAVECKRYSPERAVGREVCDKLFGVVASRGLTGGVVVTSSRFSRDALAFHQLPAVCNRLSLVDALGIHELLRQSQSRLSGV